MSNLLTIASKLRIMIGKRHKQRYDPKPLSNAQIAKKFKVAVQALMDLESIPDEIFENKSFKRDLNMMHSKLFSMYKYFDKML